MVVAQLSRGPRFESSPRQFFSTRQKARVNAAYFNVAVWYLCSRSPVTANDDDEISIVGIGHCLNSVLTNFKDNKSLLRLGSFTVSQVYFVEANLLELLLDFSFISLFIYPYMPLTLSLDPPPIPNYIDLFVNLYLNLSATDPGLTPQSYLIVGHIWDYNGHW